MILRMSKFRIADDAKHQYLVDGILKNIYTRAHSNKESSYRKFYDRKR